MSSSTQRGPNEGGWALWRCVAATVVDLDYFYEVYRRKRVRGGAAGGKEGEAVGVYRCALQVS